MLPENSPIRIALMSDMFIFSLLFCFVCVAVSEVPFRWPESCDIDRANNFTYCDTESKLLPPGDTYSDTECEYYVIPHKSLAAFLCPFTVSRISEADNNCYIFYYPNGTVLTVNIKAQQGPKHFPTETGQSTQPFNGEFLHLLCPLYGTPPLKYTWDVPISGKNLSDFNLELLQELKYNSTLRAELASEEGVPLSGILSYFDFQTGCPSGLGVIYVSEVELDGNYYCTGTNEYGTATVPVTVIDNGFLCISSSNLALSNPKDRVMQLEEQLKISPEDIGTNITIVCKLSPFSSNVDMFWVKTGDLNEVSTCTKDASASPFVLKTDSKYSVRSEMLSLKTDSYTGPNCTRALSLTIHGIQVSDETLYSCVADVCTSVDGGIRIDRTVAVSGDKNITRDMIWILSFLSVPVIAIAVSLVVACVLIYVYKVRLIRWYISWKREEPIGPFQWDVFICTPEECSRELMREVQRELIDRLSGLRVLWPYHPEFNLSGRNHYVNGCHLVSVCRKFVFVVDSRFQDCFFCKQMTELAVEQSSVKNWNIVLPVKWYSDAPVPGDLLVYRYVERQEQGDFWQEVDCFVQSRSLPQRNEQRNMNECEMTELNESSDSLHTLLIPQ